MALYVMNDTSLFEEKQKKEGVFFLSDSLQVFLFFFSFQLQSMSHCITFLTSRNVRTERKTTFLLVVVGTFSP